MKFKNTLLFFAMFLIYSNSFSQTGEEQQFNFVYNLYKTKMYNLTVKESENYIQNFPRSKYLPQIHYIAGKSAENLGDLITAKNFYFTIIDKYPNSQFAHEVYYSLGEVAFKNENYSDAKKYFEKIMNDYTDSSKMSNSIKYLGIIEFEKGNLIRAKEIFNRFIGKYSSSEDLNEIYFFLLKISVKMSQIEDIEELLNKINIEKLSDEEQSYMSNKLTEVIFNSEKSMNTVLLNKIDLELLSNENFKRFIIILWKNRNFEKIKELKEKIISEFPEDSQIWKILVFNAAELNDSDFIENSLNNYISNAQWDENLYEIIHKIISYYKEKKEDELIIFLNGLLNQKKSWDTEFGSQTLVYIYYELYIIYNGEKNYPKTAYFLNKLLNAQSNPEKNLYLKTAEIYINNLKNYLLAEEVLKDLLIEFPNENNNYAYYLLGNVYEKMDNHKGALNSYNKISPFDNKDFDIVQKRIDAVGKAISIKEEIEYVKTMILLEKEPERYFYQGRLFQLLEKDEDALNKYALYISGNGGKSNTAKINMIEIQSQCCKNELNFDEIDDLIASENGVSDYDKMRLLNTVISLKDTAAVQKEVEEFKTIAFKDDKIEEIKEFSEIYIFTQFMMNSLSDSEAEERLLQLLLSKESPYFKWSAKELMDIYTQNKNDAALLQLYSKFPDNIKNSGTGINMKIRIAALTAAQNQYKNAENMLRKLLFENLTDEQRIRVNYLLGSIYESMNLPDDAYVHFEEIVFSRNPGNEYLQKCVTKIYEIYKNNDRQKLQIFFERVLLKKDLPQETADFINYRLGKILEKQEPENALQYFEKYVESAVSDSFYIDGMKTLGELYFDLGMHKQSIDLYRKMMPYLMSDNELKNAQLKISYSNIIIGQLDEGKSLFEKAEDNYDITDKDRYLYYKYLTIFTIKTKNPNKTAIDKMEKYASAEDLAEVNYYYGIYYLNEEKYDKSENFLKKSIQKGYDKAKAYIALGNLYYYSGEGKKAYDNFLKSYNIEKSDEVLYNLALLAKQNEFYTEAVEYYRELIDISEIDEQKTDAWTNLLYSLIGAKRYSEVLDAIESGGYELDKPDAAAVQYYKAEALFGLNRFEEAVTEFLRIEYIYSGDRDLAATSYIKAAESYIILEQFDAAKEILNKVKRDFPGSKWSKRADEILEKLEN